MAFSSSSQVDSVRVDKSLRVHVGLVFVWSLPWRTVRGDHRPNRHIHKRGAFDGGVVVYIERGIYRKKGCF